ncbi:uncharacterized protein LOC144095000 isoform X2 [Amblyomma americanum]
MLGMGVVCQWLRGIACRHWAVTPHSANSWQCACGAKKSSPRGASQVLLPLVAHSIYICYPARDSASLHQVTQFVSYHVPPFVHQAAPSRIASSPYHSKAAPWSSTASSTPVFKRWCPWDRFSGHESSVAATMAKRPPLFVMQQKQRPLFLAHGRCT